MSATTSLEPTSSGGSCSCSSQRCLIVILQTRVQVVYLLFILLMDKILHQLIGSLSHYIFTRFYTYHAVQDFVHQQYLLMSKAPALSFWPQSASPAGSCDCPVGSVHAGPWRLRRGFSEHTRNMGQNPEKLGCENRTTNLHCYLILQQSVFH